MRDAIYLGVYLVMKQKEGSILLEDDDIQYFRPTGTAIHHVTSVSKLLIMSIL